jgi:hypothetical protein
MKKMYSEIHRKVIAVKGEYFALYESNFAYMLFASEALLLLVNGK